MCVPIKNVLYMYTKFVYVYEMFCTSTKCCVLICGGRGIVGNHVWVTVVACTCMLSCTPHKVIA